MSCIIVCVSLSYRRFILALGLVHPFHDIRDIALFKPWAANGLSVDETTMRYIWWWQTRSCSDNNPVKMLHACDQDNLSTVCTSLSKVLLFTQHQLIDMHRQHSSCTLYSTVYRACHHQWYKSICSGNNRMGVPPPEFFDRFIFTEQ